MHSLTTLFGTTVGALVDRFRSPLATPMPVQLNGGRQFHIHARFNWPVWASLSEAVSGSSNSQEPSVGTVHSPAGNSTADAPRSDSTARSGPAAAGGLAQLRTGDAQIASVIDKIRRVLDRDIPTLILGETGTGKELLARAIHMDSARAKQPFVAVNCASIPETLIEAELFGYEDGAFTGARRKGAVGKIVQANGGTLFLDEIGDMPVALQAHLLRVLQERQVTPLGSTKSVAVDVSIICATHRNLREMIDAKLFREDLFYRLNGLAVRLPPLRERSDLMALVRRILDQLAEPGGRPRHLQPNADVLRLFQHYHWPGNVRQLFNVLRTAAVMAANEPVITREHLSDDFLDEALAAQAAPAAGAASAAAPDPAPAARAEAPASLVVPSPADLPPPAPVAAVPARWSGEAAGSPKSLEEMEIDAIRRAVDEAGGNISVASKRLGISRNTIYRKLRWNTPK
jgi:transcriptional regulator with PAS, ATPase and Fis domain